MRSNRHKIRKIIVAILLAISVLSAALLLLSAFSGTLPPQDHPRLSLLPLFFPFFLLANIILLVIWLFIKRRLALIPLAAMIICITDIRAYFPVNIPENVPDETIKILSLNTGGVAIDKKEEFIQYFLDSGADIICLQEVFGKGGWVTDPRIREIYPHIVTLSDKSKMSCVSRFPILGTEQIKYQSAGNMSAAFYLNVNGDTVMVVNNHLQSNRINTSLLTKFERATDISTNFKERGQTTRSLISKIMESGKLRGPQVETVCDYIEKHPSRYIVVCGDFNETANGYAHYMFTKHLNDAYTRTANGFGFTYNNHKIRCRIDHILCSENIEPFNCTIDKLCKISDHFPIICDLKLR